MDLKETATNITSREEKSSSDGLSSRLGIAEQSISELEDIKKSHHAKHLQKVEGKYKTKA